MRCPVQRFPMIIDHSGRRYELDWLRVFAILIVFVYHSSRFFNLGNWLDIHPAGVNGWAGDTDDPISIVLKHSGNHTIRIQPRQIPHRIDQIWLSRFQQRIPNTLKPIR